MDEVFPAVTCQEVKWVYKNLKAERSESYG
jgi:hypothetical protein